MAGIKSTTTADNFVKWVGQQPSRGSLGRGIRNRAFVTRPERSASLDDSIPHIWGRSI